MQALRRPTTRVAVSGRAVVAAPRLSAARVRPPTHVARVAELDGLSAWEEHVLKSDKPVLVDFWAVWCGPCKLVAPLMDWAEKEYGGALRVVKVNHTGNDELVARYKVYGLPTLMLFKDGQLVEGSHREGAISKAQLQRYIEAHVLEVVQA